MGDHLDAASEEQDDDRGRYLCITKLYMYCCGTGFIGIDLAAIISLFISNGHTVVITMETFGNVQGAREFLPYWDAEPHRLPSLSSPSLLETCPKSSYLQRRGLDEAQRRIGLGWISRFVIRHHSRCDITMSHVHAPQTAYSSVTS